MNKPLSWSRRHMAAVPLVLALALIVTACGSSSAKGSSSPTTGASGSSGASKNSGASAPGVTASSITIGATAILTGPAAPGYSEIAPATNAVFKWANAHGGVYGRQVHYIYVDDGYNPANTAVKTRELVLQDHILASMGGIGTPTQSAVQGFLNTEKVPQLFIESGCVCWNNPKYPYSFGWQPNYTVEGKILGTYIKDHFPGEKVGELYQNDDFGQGFVAGVNQEVPSSDVVSRQTYDPLTLSGPLSNQVAALKAAGAQVVALATIPAATALTLIPAASIGYSPQWVASSVGTDPPTVIPLLSSYSKGAAGASLLKNLITNAYIPPEADASNAWVQVTKKLLRDYDPGAPFDGNTEVGVAIGFTMLQALQKAGPDLTRQSLINAVENDGSSFVTPGLVPLNYSKSDHYGYSGSEVVKYQNGAFTPVSPIYVTTNNGPVTTYRGSPSPPPANLVASA